MYTQLAEIPVPLSAAFLNNEVVQITYSARHHVSNTKKTLTKIIPLTESIPINLPLQEVGETVASAISSSCSLRANLREIKHPSTKRFVEIWSGNRMDISVEVTDHHQAFYLDEYLSTLIFSPSETALLYTAEAKAPHNSTEDPYAKFRYRPSFGEGFGEKKRPRFFLLRWRSPTDPNPLSMKPRLYEIHPENDDILFGQGIFFPTPEETTIYATGYEFTPNGRLLGIKGCFNRPFGVWELHFQTQSDEDHHNNEDKKHDLIVSFARKISDTNSGRSPRILQEDTRSTLYWFSSNAGGPHLSTTSLHSLDITSLDASSPENNSKTARTVIPIPDAPGVDFPGLYPPFNLPNSPFLQHRAGPVELILQSQWGSRTTILSVCPATGVVKHLTPPEPALFSWALLATDGKNRIVCSRSSAAIPYQVLLGTFSENGLQWSNLDQPDLAPDVLSALQSIRTTVHPIPGRYPTETIVVRTVPLAETQGQPPPLVSIPHGGPHAASTTAFSANLTALALEGYTLSMPNYSGTPGYGQGHIYQLLGRCGTLDVEDVHASTLHVVNDLQLARFGKGEIFVMGGSHGGFIAAHLVSKYPDVYGAAILRNPVISCGEVAGTDIPDWYFAEFGFQEDFPMKSSPMSSDLSTILKSPATPNFDAAPHVTPHIFQELYEASPSTALVRFFKNRSQTSKAFQKLPPVLLLIGASDKRVSPTQGITFYHLLKGAGEDVEILIFDGEGHPLEGVEAAKVGWEAGRDWLKRYRREE